MPIEATTEFARATLRGLSRRPRELEARFLYDAVGSEIYERITEQPEYYLTGAEDALLSQHATDIRGRLSGDTLVELGSGSSTKTRRLLDTGFRHYLPIDISAAALQSARKDLSSQYPGLQIEDMTATYGDGLRKAGGHNPSLISFLGSSIGNLTDSETSTLLRQVSDALTPGSHFLLGVDLIKDTARLEAAYNDAAGFSERFTLNILDRMVRELGAVIPEGVIGHRALYNEDKERIEIYAEFHRPGTIHVLGHQFEFQQGERIRTEISRKYRIENLQVNASRHGLMLETSYSNGEMALLLLRRTGSVQ